MIGDGVLRFLDESGLLSAGGLDFVHAHEFGHHVQFRLDHAYPDDRGYDNDDDDNRREELMADAIGGYYLAHDEGGDATRREIDCSTMPLTPRATARAAAAAAAARWRRRPGRIITARRIRGGAPPRGGRDSR
jgi:predicted metalloprotease